MHKKEYIEIRRVLGDLISNFAIVGNCRLRNGQGRQSLEGPGSGLNPYTGTPPTMGLLTVMWAMPYMHDNLLTWHGCF